MACGVQCCLDYKRRAKESFTKLKLANYVYNVRYIPVRCTRRRQARKSSEKVVESTSERSRTVIENAREYCAYMEAWECVTLNILQYLDTVAGHDGKKGHVKEVFG